MHENRHETWDIFRQSKDNKAGRLDPECRPGPDLAPRPTCRDECDNVPRPCPYISCRYHLYLETKPNGSIVVLRKGIEPWELPPDESCALDVADDYEHRNNTEAFADMVTLERIGDMTGVTRERTRQHVLEAIDSIRVHWEEIADE